MQTTFDPYAQWLSLPAGGRPPDYYQLLGLTPLEADLFRIIAAADRQISRVLPFLEGQHADQARLLLDELLKAKGCLITPAAKALYDAEFRRRLAESDSPEDAALLELLAQRPPPELQAPPPSQAPPIAAPPPAPPTATAQPPLPPPLPAADAPSVVAPPVLAKTAASDAPGTGVVRATLVAPPGAAFAGTVAIPAAANVSIAVPATERPLAVGEGGLDPTTGQGPSDASSVADRPDWPLVAARAVRGAPRSGSWIGPLAAFVVTLGAVGIAAALAMQRGWPEQAVAQGGTQARPQQTEQGSPDPQQIDSPVVSAATPSPDGQPSMPDETHSSHADAPPRSKSPPNKPQPPAVDPPPDSVTPSKPGPKPQDPPPKPARPASSDPNQAKELGEALALVREALAARDVPSADKQLKAADALASSPELTARVAVVRLLRDYVDGFWNAVRESAKTLKGGEEFTVRDKVVVIVEARPNEIVLRASGENRAYKLAELPPHMATALAERWLAADDPNSPLFVAAFWMVDPKIERELARAKLTAAAAAGAKDAAALRALIDSPW